MVRAAAGPGASRRVYAELPRSQTLVVPTLSSDDPLPEAAIVRIRSTKDAAFADNALRPPAERPCELSMLDAASRSKEHAAAGGENTGCGYWDLLRTRRLLAKERHSFLSPKPLSESSPGSSVSSPLHLEAKREADRTKASSSTSSIPHWKKEWLRTRAAEEEQLPRLRSSEGDTFARPVRRLSPPGRRASPHGRHVSPRGRRIEELLDDSVGLTALYHSVRARRKVLARGSNAHGSAGTGAGAGVDPGALETQPPGEQPAPGASGAPLDVSNRQGHCAST